MDINFVNPAPPPETQEQALARLRVEAAEATAKVHRAEAQEREQESVREHEQKLRQAKESRKLFFELLAETEKERHRFQAYYREAAISLGKIAHAGGLLTQLANAVSRIIPDPEITAAMKTATLPPAPLETLEAEGFKASAHHGWNWNIALPPLRPKGGNGNV